MKFLKKTKKEADRLLGETYKMREDWDEVKVALMRNFISEVYSKS